MLGLKHRLAKQAVVATKHRDFLPGRLLLPQSGRKLTAATAAIPSYPGQSTAFASRSLIAEFNPAAVTKPVGQSILPYASALFG
jgi:hypothetical protein